MKKNKKLLLALIFLLLSDCSFAGLYSNIENGAKEYRKNHFKAAKNYFIQYTNNNPNDKDGFWWLGMTNFKLKNENEANENFKKAYDIFLGEKDVEKINFDEETNENIGDYIEIAKAFFDDGNLVEAEFYADMILKINPKSPTALFIKAKAAQINNNLELSKEYLTKAIKYENRLLDTNLAKTLQITSVPELSEQEFLSSAYELFFKGNIDKAIKHLIKYTNLNNANYEAYNFLAELYYLNGSYEFAQETVEKAKKLNDKSIKTYLIESKVNKEKEEKSLLKAFEINPNNQETLLLLGNYYLKKENYKKAQEYFSSLLSINDKLYEGYAGLTLCLIKKGKFDEALKNIRKLPLINPNQTETTALLAEICMLQNNYKEALDYINEAIKKEKNPNYLLKKAQIQHSLKQYDDSIKTLQEIALLPYQPDNSNRVYELYMMNFLKKNNYSALQSYIASNQNTLDKNSLIYKYNLYKIYKYDNDKKSEKLQAIKVFSSLPSTINDFIALSEIIFDEKGEKSAIKFLNNAIKHNEDLADELNLQKEKINFFAKNH